jgi:flagellar basal-body rod modification protein FlgD
MASIQNVGTTTAPPAAPTATGPKSLGKDDFLKLLVTQLRHQDPLNPLDQNQFLAQTAQFTSLEHLQNISRGLEDLRAVSGTSGLAQSASVIGRTARIGRGDVDYDGQHAVALPFTVDGDASAVIVEVLDQGGAVLRQMTTTGEGGARAVTWDGRDGSGSALTAGRYAYRVSTPDGSAGRVAVSEGKITALSLDDGAVSYRIGPMAVRPEDVVDLR